VPGNGRSRANRSSQRLAEELDRLLIEVGRGVEAVVDRPHATPAMLHDLHRDMRRLRTGLAVWEELLQKPDRTQLGPIDRRIRRLAQLIGQVRDRDVAVDLLGSVEAKARSEEERELLDRYRARLHDDARTGRELLRAFLRSERDALLFDEVRAVLQARARPTRSDRLHRLLTEHKNSGHAKLVEAHRKARRRPTMDRLHRLRIRVRRLRQISDLASTVDPDPPGAVTASLRRLQQHLGRLHDLDVLLVGLDPSVRETRWARSLRKERRRQRREVVRTIQSFRPDRELSPKPASGPPLREAHRPAH
jgi:CHAD domain-containing protein